RAMNADAALPRAVPERNRTIGWGAFGFCLGLTVWVTVGSFLTSRSGWTAAGNGGEMLASLVGISICNIGKPSRRAVSLGLLVGLALPGLLVVLAHPHDLGPWLRGTL